MPEHFTLIWRAALCSAVAFVLLIVFRPPFRIGPFTKVREVALPALVGVISVAGIQAWNTLQFAPSQLEQAVSTAVDLSATRTVDGLTKVSGTITVTNPGDVPAVLVASEYVLWAVNVTDTGDWPLGSPDPLEPNELADNGSAARAVIGVGIPFRPYQRIGAKSEAVFRVALSTNRTTRLPVPAPALHGARRPVPST